MTTSGITTTQLNRNSVINAALRKIGAIALGQTPSTEEYTNGIEALNNHVAELQTLGMPLWSQKTLDITMVSGQRKYTIGIGQSINVAFPLKVIQAWTALTTGTGSRQELVPKAIFDFNLLPSDANATGSPSSYMYQPFINYGELSLWPTPDSSAANTKTLTISYMSPFEDFINSTDTPYFPKEWNNTLIYGVALLLAPEYGIPPNDQGLLRHEYDKHLEIALDFGSELASVFFEPQGRV